MITQKYSIMCDDVRQENNGKFLLIGVYMDAITVPQLPATIPGLTFFNRLQVDRLGNYTLRAKVENAETGRGMAEAIIMMRIDQLPGSHGTAIIAPRFPNVQFDRAGSYTFSLTVDGEREPIVLTTFDLMLVIPAAGQQQPIR